MNDVQAITVKQLRKELSAMRDDDMVWLTTKDQVLAVTGVAATTHCGTDYTVIETVVYRHRSEWEKNSYAK
jgi:Xaa-Pro aminopeptidase